jgi:hypothetical protein
MMLYITIIPVGTHVAISSRVIGDGIAEMNISQTHEVLDVGKHSVCLSFEQQQVCVRVFICM